MAGNHLFVKTQTSQATPWRNGSASDSRSEGCVFESRRGHQTFFILFFYMYVYLFVRCGFLLQFVFLYFKLRRNKTEKQNVYFFSISPPNFVSVVKKCNVKPAQGIPQLLVSQSCESVAANHLFVKTETSQATPWRNGSASDSRSEGCMFESRRGHQTFLFLYFYVCLSICEVWAFVFCFCFLVF